MGASLVFLVLRFSVVLWALAVHRSAGQLANDVVPPAVPPSSSIASHRVMVSAPPPRSHIGKHPAMHGLRRPKIDTPAPQIATPAPHGLPLPQRARSWTDLDGSRPENSYYKHHHHHHHHHHAKSQSPSSAVSPAYAASPSHSPYSSTISQTSTHAPPIFSEMPIHSPSVPSLSSSVKMTPPPSSTLALPPPPPNQDCTTLTCTEPLTYTPSGFTCGCVWPIQVKIRLSVALYTFFTLVSELAAEIASSLSLNQSQVRIVGANAADQQLEKTAVLLNLVPLERKFNYSAAFSAYKKFWHRQIRINSFLFGASEVLDVHYPGLPPSPPSIASNLAAIDDHPYPAKNKGNDGSLLKPLGVNVLRRIKNRSNRSLLAAIVVSSITALIICASIAWVLPVRYRYSAATRA